MKITIEIPDSFVPYVERLRRGGLYGETLEKTAASLVRDGVFAAFDGGRLSWMDEAERALFKPPVGGIG